MGSVFENTQIVFISEPLNDFAPVVNVVTAPQIGVSIEVACDKYQASNISDQVWQISGGEVVVAWDVDRKDSDRCTTQGYLDCYRLHVWVNLNLSVVESFFLYRSGLLHMAAGLDSSLAICYSSRSWHIGSDSGVESVLI